MSDVIEIAASWSGKVDRSGGPTSCWPWTGGLMTNGYGQSRVKENGRWRSAGAHQIALFLKTGRWERKSDRRLVRHLCHNRRCCNPAHLKGGDYFDNAGDLDARRRGVSLLPTYSLTLAVTGIACDLWPCPGCIGCWPLRRERQSALTQGEAA